MPEIAEVEISRRQCLHLVGKRLEEVVVFDQKIDDNFQTLLDSSLTDVLRCGKRLGLIFNNQAIIIHLRMTGRLALAANKAARLKLVFGDNHYLSFIDPRRFGTVKLGDPLDLRAGLGPDLFNDWPFQLPLTSSRSHKAVILDQQVVAGIGNYLADESLFRAKIHPQQKASSLTTAEANKILTEAHSLASQTLERGGVSLRDYLSPSGQEGSGQGLLVCYGRASLPCLRCQTPLIKIKVAGRGTTLCPNCQSL